MIIVASAAPSKTILHYPLTQRRLLPHCNRIFLLVQQSMQKTMNNEINLQWQNNAYHELADLYSDQKRMKEAEDMYLRALAGYEKAWGAEHTLTLNTRYKVAVIYQKKKNI